MLLRHTLLQRLARPALLLLVKKGQAPTIARLPFISFNVASFQTSIIKCTTRDGDKDNSTSKDRLGPPQSLYLIPSLHQRVVDKLSADGLSPVPEFDETDQNDNPENTCNTHVMGKFRCSKDGCDGIWTSKKVAIEIRRFRGNTYNAPVFNQRCKECDTLGILTVNEDIYVERVVYWLKKWAGMKVKRPKGTGIHHGLEHEREYCEGCRMGKCT
ncbi:zinc-binding domain-containing protein [Podospora fimiseda]|uniref:Zinc-binding domain-containing protein n=1 Tax=Podospora fimiseda TaxID=252190 RepID=A0AAN7BHX8_9PEZI|nr:zinc-binding domain-containing protein [Podospora fimiseda]